jgi:hypothetical protein
MSDQATLDMVWGLIDRIQREEHNITPRAISKIHAILDDCGTNIFPDLSTQTAQAAWLKDRIQRDDR